MALAGFVWQFILEKVMKTEPLGWHSPSVPATVRRPWRVFADRSKSSRMMKLAYYMNEEQEKTKGMHSIGKAEQSESKAKANQRQKENKTKAKRR